METVSENKRHRGRPRVIPHELEGPVSFIGPNVQTDRGRQNVFYRMRALDILSDLERFKWLCDEEKIMANVPRAMKPTILTELGRFQDDDEMREVAGILCEHKPKTKRAVALIRLIRQGKK